MFSWGRRFQLSLRHTISPFCSYSQGFTSSSSSSFSSSSSSSSSFSTFPGSRHGDKRFRDLHVFLTSITSGVAVVGSTLGFWYWSALSSPGDNSLHSFSDAAKVDQLQQNYETKSKFLFNDGYRRRVFFNYEKRIRLQSPPEKIFDYFASVRAPSGEVFMTPADLMRAIVPVFPPSESNRIREGYLRGEQVPGQLQCEPSQFFMLFDTNNDGLISFAEYIFFVTLLSIPESSFSVAFKMIDTDNNGEIDELEFKKVMTLMRSQNRQGANHRDGRRLGSKVSIENGGLLEYFFGKDGKTCLQHERFVEFLRQLHDEILRLEFSHYDYNKKGTISAKDFALSLVASADFNEISRLLDRVDGLNSHQQLRDIRITFKEFQEFAELRKKLQPFSLAMFSYGKVNGVLTKPDFQRAASQVCGICITDRVVDIIFYVFDANNDGNLSANEFFKVLQRRENHSPRFGFVSLISCWLNCVNNCSSAKLQF
ncbi:calcium uptake protein, mitochondrial [Cajanus cajan]|uniref:Calcium-binding atopy-related autoantigen 1 n=1 Tax=Cajanus cajan TaxID=3821 RepID=A0A151SRD1_CAJCA|nr:calcium uptake protein, mitochondrial [Cajanus cajan]KYP57345.1 Calcium-binding atopy-related autoantigen 1 [Cajanus cajan]